jgi:hypothetical protein
MVDNAFRIAVDPLFPPPEGFGIKKGALGEFGENRFKLVFDERIDGPILWDVLKQQDKVISKVNISHNIIFNFS